MSNLAGKAYAMNVITPIKRWQAYINKLHFWVLDLPFFSRKLKGLITLSLIHYARWVIVHPNQFPRLSPEQPKEDLKYSYMLFFSNFNGSWKQYVDSFHMAIPKGLDLIWDHNIRYPKAVPLEPFHSYILHNQIWTEYYYNAYPMASSNDVKSALELKASLTKFIETTPANETSEQFQERYFELLFTNQAHLSRMAPEPVVSLAAQAVEERRRLNVLPSAQSIQQ